MADEKAKIEIVESAVGVSIYINNYRIAGSSPLGGGRVQHTFMCKESEILKPLAVTNKAPNSN